VLTDFTTDQVDRAWQRLEHWTGIPYDTAARDLVESAYTMTKIVEPVLNWDGLGIEMSEELLMEQIKATMDRVRWRMTACG